MQAAARVGVTTAELDAVAAETFNRLGARSAPQLTYGFPGITCIGVNDAHEEHMIVITKGTPLVVTVAA